MRKIGMHAGVPAKDDGDMKKKLAEARKESKRLREENKVLLAETGRLREENEALRAAGDGGKKE